MIDRKSIELAIEDLRPQFRMDGGDIQIKDISADGVVEIILGGACDGCSMASEHIKYGVETYIRDLVPDIKEIIIFSI